MADENSPVDTGVTLPEDLSGATEKELNSFKAKIATKFKALAGKDTTSASDLAIMAGLKGQMDTVREVESARAAEQEEIKAQRQALVEGMGGDDDAPAEDAPVEGDQPIEITGEVGDGVEVEGEAVEVEGEAVDAAPMEALAAALTAALTAVTAGAKAPAKVTDRPTGPTIGAAARAGRARALASGNGGEKFGAVSIVASSDTPGVSQGAELDNDQLTDAIMRRARSMGVSTGSGQKALVASIERTNVRNDIRNVRGNKDVLAAWDKAHNPESLVASGGWCSPSETMYDFACDYEAMPDTVDLPTLTASRGGIIVPESLKLSDFIAVDGIGMTWTEAMDIAAAANDGTDDTLKVCAEIPCPDFMPDVRLEAFYSCLKAGNLVDRSWPELVSRSRDLALTAHAHRMNALKISKMVAQSTLRAPVGDTDLSAAESLLSYLEFELARFRDVEFTDNNFTLEVVLPRWVRHIVRRDLARRAGVLFDQVSDEQINGYFSELGLRVQWVTNWQMLATGATSYPATVTILFYPAGAYTLLDGGQLDLAVIRDSVLNETNDHTLLFFEEFFQVMSRCAGYRMVVPVCATGSTGVAAAIACPTV